MPHYSVATTKDQLSSLIDKALAGEEVIITRHGKVAVEMRPVREATANTPETTPEGRSHAEWATWLKDRRESRPPLGMNAADLVRRMRDEAE